MRQNGHGALTLEDARTWIEETGLCLFLPRRQFSASVAPSFVEAIAGQRNPTPDPAHIALAEELLVRLENDSVAVRLNLLGHPGEQPDFVVAAWVLPYVYALRGDRDWRRNPQLTGSRQVSQLAVQAYKLLEAGDAPIPSLKQALGREVTDAAVLRAITELWQQLRIIPSIPEPGKPAMWQLLRHRFQKAIAEGASTSQVTAISVLASIYLQAVIAASMEEVEIFLAPLTARSKVREVLRGLVATRQVHTLSMGHAPHYYVAGTLPEFAAPQTAYTSSAMLGSAYYLRSRLLDDDSHEAESHEAALPSMTSASESRPSAEERAPRSAPSRKPAANGKSAPQRAHFSRPAAHVRDRKPAQPASASRPARRAKPDARTAGARPAGPLKATGSRPASESRWGSPDRANANRNGSHAPSAPKDAKTSNGRSPRYPAGPRTTGDKKSEATSRSQANGRSSSARNGVKPASGSRNGSASRKEVRPESRSHRQPALAAGTKAGNSKRFGFTARPQKQETKKRG